jgi:hypothetical protein
MFPSHRQGEGAMLGSVDAAPADPLIAVIA